MAKLTGGGIQGNKNVNVGVRTRHRKQRLLTRGSRPDRCNQQHFKKDKVDAGPGYQPH